MVRLFDNSTEEIYLLLYSQLTEPNPIKVTKQEQLYNTSAQYCNKQASEPGVRDNEPVICL